MDWEVDRDKKGGEDVVLDGGDGRGVRGWKTGRRGVIVGGERFEDLSERVPR